MCAKLRTVAASNNKSSHAVIACSCHIYVWCCSSRTSCPWWITHLTQHHRRGCNIIPSFLQRTTPIARSLCEGWPWHDLHILVTAPFCCDRKSRAACAQSFAPWQQATIEITCHDHSIIAFSRHIYVWCCSSRTSRSWWIAHSMQHHRRGCNNSKCYRNLRRMKILVSKHLMQLCPTQMAYWAKNYVTILTNTSNRAAHWMAYFGLGKPNLGETNVLKTFES